MQNVQHNTRARKLSLPQLGFTSFSFVYKPWGGHVMLWLMIFDPERLPDIPKLPMHTSIYTSMLHPCIHAGIHPYIHARIHLYIHVQRCSCVSGCLQSKYLLYKKHITHPCLCHKGRVQSQSHAYSFTFSLYIILLITNV